MANDCAHRETEKMIFSADKTHENVGADVYCSRREERKKSECTTQNTRISPDSVPLNIRKEMNVSGEQCCAIEFCVHLKKMLSETTALLKEAFGKER